MRPHAKPRSEPGVDDRRVKRLLMAFAASAVLAATGASAQTAGPATPASAAIQPAEAAAPQPEPVKPPPRYSATDIERVFNFMDANHDGQLSRQEAAGFKNVARHFDAADTNQDGVLSLTEFANALNRP